MNDVSRLPRQKKEHAGEEPFGYSSETASEVMGEGGHSGVQVVARGLGYDAGFCAQRCSHAPSFFFRLSSVCNFYMWSFISTLVLVLAWLVSALGMIRRWIHRAN